MKEGGRLKKEPFKLKTITRIVRARQGRRNVFSLGGAKAL